MNVYQKNTTLTPFFYVVLNILPLLHVYDFELEVERNISNKA